MELNLKTEGQASSPTTQRIIELLLDGQKHGKAPRTIQTWSNILRILSKRANLNIPDEVIEAVASMKVSGTYKRNLMKTYVLYVKFHKLLPTVSTLPKYDRDTKMPKIPSKEKVEMLISASGKELALKLKIMNDTGLRPIEVVNLRLRDIDLDQRILYPIVVKHGAPRSPPFTPQLEAMLRTYLADKNLQPNDKLFNCTTHTFGNNYREMRDALANKLKDPTLKTIRLYDFRHYFATMLYYKSNNIILVKNLMGHKHLDTTMIYTQLVNFNGDEYIVKSATTIQEIEALASDGYTKFDEFNGIHIFRKRK